MLIQWNTPPLYPDLCMCCRRWLTALRILSSLPTDMSMHRFSWGSQLGWPHCLEKNAYDIRIKFNKYSVFLKDFPFSFTVLRWFRLIDHIIAFVWLNWHVTNFLRYDHNCWNDQHQWLSDVHSLVHGHKFHFFVIAYWTFNAWTWKVYLYVSNIQSWCIIVKSNALVIV